MFEIYKAFHEYTIPDHFRSFLSDNGWLSKKYNDYVIGERAKEVKEMNGESKKEMDVILLFTNFDKWLMKHGGNEGERVLLIRD